MGQSMRDNRSHVFHTFIRWSLSTTSYLPGVSTRNNRVPRPPCHNKKLLLINENHTSIQNKI